MDMECREVDGDICIWSAGRWMVIYGYGVLGGDGDIWIWSVGRGMVIYGYGVMGGGW
jgi:hypothetical protein